MTFQLHRINSEYNPLLPPSLFSFDVALVLIHAIFVICSPGKSVEKHSHVNSRRSSEPVSNAKPDVVPRKQVASNLNIASPPFYPTGSSTKDNTAPPKRDVQAGTINRNGQQSVVDENFTMSQSTATMRGKNVVDSMENLSMGDSSSSVPVKSSNTMQMPLPGSSSFNPGQPQLRGQGRGPASFTQMAYQPVVSNNQLNRVPPPNQLQNVQRNPGQSRAQSSLQGSVQQFTQRVPSGSQAFSPPKAAGAVNTSESGEMESASDMNQPKTALVAKGKGNAPGSAKGSFLYGGAQVMGSSGSMGSGPGDQNFPAFLPGIMPVFKRTRKYIQVCMVSFFSVKFLRMGFLSDFSK